MGGASRFNVLSDQALLTEAAELANHERMATVDLILALAVIDERKLYLGQGCSSMFTYCTQILQLSEHAAYDRIEAARLGRRFPIAMERLACGALTLTNLRLLGPHLEPETADALLDQAAFKSKYEVETLVAGLRADPETGEETYTLQITISGAMREKLREAQDLWRHVIPDGDVVKILDKALTLLVKAGKRQKAGATDHPRPARPPNVDARRPSVQVQREVWARDGAQCTFVGPNGRCQERGFLEFHHLRPYAVGGKSTTPNVCLRCRAHNQYEASLFFGQDIPAPEAVSTSPEVAPASPEVSSAAPATSSTPEAESATPDVSPASPEVSSATREASSATPDVSSATPKVSSGTPEVSSATREVTPLSPDISSAAPGTGPDPPDE